MPGKETDKDEDQKLELKCPECGATVTVALAVAERENKAVCHKGHEIPLAKALG